MDNASIHYQSHSKEYFAEINNVIFNSPYSPDGNPIEQCFAIIKNTVKKMLIMENVNFLDAIQHGIKSLSNIQVKKCF